MEIMQNSLIRYFELDGIENSNGEDDTSDTPLLGQENVSTKEESETPSFVDDLMADIEEHTPPDETSITE